MARKMRTKKQRRRLALEAAEKQEKCLPRWRYKSYIRSDKWAAKRGQKFDAVGWQCERCQSKLKLHVHHKSYERLGYEHMDDLEVLCEMCHLDHHLGEAFGVDPSAFDQIAWRI